MRKAPRHLNKGTYALQQVPLPSSTLVSPPPQPEMQPLFAVPCRNLLCPVFASWRLHLLFSYNGAFRWKRHAVK